MFNSLESSDSNQPKIVEKKESQFVSENPSCIAKLQVNLIKLQKQTDYWKNQQIETRKFALAVNKNDEYLDTINPLLLEGLGVVSGKCLDKNTDYLVSNIMDNSAKESNRQAIDCVIKFVAINTIVFCLENNQHTKEIFESMKSLISIAITLYNTSLGLSLVNNTIISPSFIHLHELQKSEVISALLVENLNLNIGNKDLQNAVLGKDLTQMVEEYSKAEKINPNPIIKELIQEARKILVQANIDKQAVKS